MRGDIPAKPSPVEKVDRPSLYAKVETDEVFVTKSNVSLPLREHVTKRP